MTKEAKRGCITSNKQGESLLVVKSLSCLDFLTMERKIYISWPIKKAHASERSGGVTWLDGLTMMIRNVTYKVIRSSLVLSELHSSANHAREPRHQAEGTKRKTKKLEASEPPRKIFILFFSRVSRTELEFSKNVATILLGSNPSSVSG